MEYPIVVQSISSDNFKSNPFSHGISCDIGSFVSIQPCADEYKDKTYLGLFLGNMSVGVGCSYNPEDGELVIQRGLDNPAISVLDIQKVIFGYESWLCKIKTEKQLKEITDNDINNVWYVKALEKLLEEKNDE